ncbi:hypothetical protein FRX31_004492 [Thalictrum thalictroides]|uniref:Uncharacterized protein n=1 Tax=Thalictrum thalictroides TaxID=46969 RepID=A0A7J6X876_THATH|nr:hypothetical protein FRX31_004492 [Thalictrum thalictroides]
MEPRTLNEGQINHARKAAVNIIQNTESNESSTAFIEGLKPVVPIKEIEEMFERRHQFQKLVDSKETAVAAIEPAAVHNCACNTVNVDESPDMAKIREPLSAPF